LFDVGIAEEHAVSMAGGLAKQGMVPVVALYSTFLQRSFDMILQDICMLGLHVVFAVDRAGLVGEDGETHHGIFDVGFLRQAPGMTVLCPGSMAELRDMLIWAIFDHNGPVAIRYPRGTDRGCTVSSWPQKADIAQKGVLSCHRQGNDVALVTYGALLQNVTGAAELLEEQGIHASVLRLMSVSPLPTEQLLEQISGCRRVVVVEEACAQSGIRQSLSWELTHENPNLRVDGIDLGHQYVTHGNLQTLYEHYGLDAKSIAEYVQEVLSYEK
jgi:1-deoxy-D-xylulose-5-phosphate synthase